MKKVLANSLSVIVAVILVTSTAFAANGETKAELNFNTGPDAVQLDFLDEDLDKTELRTSQEVFDVIDGKLVGTVNENAVRGYAAFDKIPKEYAENFTYEMDVEVKSGMAGMVFREGYDFEVLEIDDWEMSFADKSYSLLMYENKVKLVSFPYADLSQETYLDTSEKHHYKIVGYGDSIKVYIDYELEPSIEINDATYTEGNLGFFVQGIGEEGKAVFDNITVSPFEGENKELDFEVDPQAVELTFFDGDLNPSEIRTTGDTYYVSQEKLVGFVDERTINGYAVFDQIDQEFTKDFTYEADIQVFSGMGGLVFREGYDFETADLLNWEGDFATKSYGLILTDNKVKLINFGTLQVLDQAYIDISEQHHYKVVADGEKIEVYIDNSILPVIEVEDAAYTEGNLGIITEALDGENGYAFYDNIVISGK